MERSSTVGDQDRLSAARERVLRLEDELIAAREELREFEREAERHAPPPVRPTHVDEHSPASSVTKDASPAERLALFRSRFAGRDDAYG